MNNVMKSLFVCAVLTAGLVTVTVSGEEFDCDNFNPMICTMDAIMYCLTNGTIVTGRCYAQRAVCLEGKTLDSTFAACGHSDTGHFDCQNYQANPLLCTKDLIPFCLSNGTVVRGTCRAKQAVCKENQRVEDDFSACNQAAAPGQRDTGDNSSNGMSASLFLLIALLVGARLF
ncbi:uncharacterized protein LOC143283292 [Babylonia areolata]|uniref:uncharacterized protein LOC143283292 n=1 Tax=Babylonia areolata TaxID=304850 RepID=UPI003FD140E7